MMLLASLLLGLMYGPENGIAVGVGETWNSPLHNATARCSPASVSPYKMLSTTIDEGGCFPYKPGCSLPTLVGPACALPDGLVDVRNGVARDCSPGNPWWLRLGALGMHGRAS